VRRPTSFPGAEGKHGVDQEFKADLNDMPGLSILRKGPDGMPYHVYSAWHPTLLELVQYNFFLDLMPNGPEMRLSERPIPFLKPKDKYQYPGGDYGV